MTRLDRSCSYLPAATPKLLVAYAVSIIMLIPVLALWAIFFPLALLVWISANLLKFAGWSWPYDVIDEYRDEHMPEKDV